MVMRTDITGQRFGRLVVVKELPRERDAYGMLKMVNGRVPPVQWFCKCDCGNTCVTTYAQLKNKQKSCGCILKELREKQREMLKEAREAAAKARAGEKALKCPYPSASCEKSKKGMCCHDCDDYQACFEKGCACLNSPAKCGVKR